MRAVKPRGQPQPKPPHGIHQRVGQRGGDDVITQRAMARQAQGEKH